MRFFVVACLFCLLIASVGCMTKNWSAPLFKGQDIPAEEAETEDGKHPESTMFSEGRNFWKGSFGKKAGLDSRAREIEKRLGY